MQLLINVTAYDHDEHHRRHHHHHHHKFAAFYILLLSMVLGGGNASFFVLCFRANVCPFFSVFCISSVIVNLGVEHISINKLFIAKL